MRKEDVKNIFESKGGLFLTPVAELAEKINGLNTVIFDWDGVFNSGEKHSEGSPFGEADSMGTNLLRFALWKKLGCMPLSVILSGENNKSSFHFGERENFNHVFYKVPNKPVAISFLQEEYKLDISKAVYFFDDVLDLPVAEVCGVRVMIKRDASPMFTEYVKNAKLADYITFSPGGYGAVREGIELLLALAGVYDDVINERLKFTEDYRLYLSKKKAVSTSIKSGKEF